MEQFSFHYKHSACDHWENCETIIKAATDIREYFYAALELRFCMERIAFQYRRLKAWDEQASESELEDFKPRDHLRAVIFDQQTADRSAEFLNAVIEIGGKDYPEIFAPNMIWFHKTYGLIGHYLHAIEKEYNKDQLAELIELVKTTHVQLKKYLPQADFKSLKPHAQQILDDYVEGRIDHSSMRKRLEISSI